MVHCERVSLLIWIVVSIGSGEGFLTATVRTTQGALRGVRLAGQSRYYGIPYAQASRFQPPLNPTTWKGIFYAINRFRTCAQRVSVFNLGTEDCLHLDVYTPDRAKPKDKLPVLVFIHGGAYYHGTKAHYDPEFLVTKNVIVVIINYRIGVLGFLCLNGVANLGLKDQAAALKWIQNNISAFGGDPDNVTLAGQSAGASAAGMHLLSKTSKGLFHKAILMSGTPVSPWAFNVEPLKPAFEDAQKISVVNNEKDVYNVFANSSISNLLTATQDTSINSRYFKYSPCVEDNSSDPFFLGAPFDIIKSGKFYKVPVIMGFTNIEGLLFHGLNDDKSFKKWDTNLIEQLPSVFSWCSEKDRRNITKKIKSHYFRDEPISRAAVRGVVDYYSDWIAYASADAFSRLLAEHSDQPVYNYVFSYEGGRNFARFALTRAPPLLGLRGATHADDVFYLFKPAGLSLPLSHPDDLFINRFTTMITNFMKFGNPTPRKTRLVPVLWPPAPCWLRLDRRLSVLEAPPDRIAGRFLLGVLCEHGRAGYVPCESAQACTHYP